MSNSGCNFLSKRNFGRRAPPNSNLLKLYNMHLASPFRLGIKAEWDTAYMAGLYQAEGSTGGHIFKITMNAGEGNTIA